MEKLITNLGRVIEKVRFSHRGERLPKRTTDCLAEERLEDYYQGALPKSERTLIDTHLVDCSLCRDRLVIFDQVVTGEELEVPPKMVAKSRQLVSEGSYHILDIVLATAQKAIRIIKNTGELLAPAPALQPARGRENQTPQDQLYDFITITKEFKDLRMDVQVECVNDTYKVLLNASDPLSRTPVAGTRLVLFSDGREMSSIEDNQAIFYLKLRKYLVKVIFDDQEIGQIRFDLRHASQN